MPRRVSLLVLAVALTACSPKEDYLSREALMDPETCQDCHPDHYEEWAGSMHAYAAEDPVFRAMNARGQRETGGELGDFCVKCHAPMAVRMGLTTDGTNLDEVPQKFQGVTCYFCHNIDAVEEDHNAGVRLANDRRMRGGIANPVKNDAHPSRYSVLHDRNDLKSADLCGSCHDIVTPKGVHLERTFAEWRETLFADDSPARQTCGHCHMRGRDGLAADYPGVQLRRVKDHSMVGVDMAITEWPQMEEQQAKIQDELDDVLAARLCVNPVAGGVEAVLRLENAAAGHSWPSGATQDRRAWVELVAYNDGEPVYETGAVEAGEPVVEVESADPDMWVFRDRIFDGEGNEVHMFWEAEDYESQLLPGAVTTDPEDPDYYHYRERTFEIIGSGTPERITVAVKIRPMGLEVLDDLIDSGDLDPSFRTSMKTFTLASTELEWTGPVGECVP